MIRNGAIILFLFSILCLFILPAAHAQINRPLTATLSIGSRNPEVKILQQFLISKNFLAPDLATGYFGRLTEKAVKIFQNRYISEILVPAGLNRPTGIVGSRTRAKINSLMGAVFPQPESVQSFTKTLKLGSLSPDVTRL